MTSQSFGQNIDVFETQGLPAAASSQFVEDAKVSDLKDPIPQIALRRVEIAGLGPDGEKTSCTRSSAAPLSRLFIAMWCKSGAKRL